MWVMVLRAGDLWRVGDLWRLSDGVAHSYNYNQDYYQDAAEQLSWAVLYYGGSCMHVYTWSWKCTVMDPGVA